MTYICMSLAAACALASCSDGPINEERSPAANAERPQSEESVPVAPRLAKPADYSGVETTQELFALLAPGDRALAAEFYGRYDPVVMQFSTHAQLDWMIDHGYPMPEDIVAASVLTEAELLALHRQGDAKAGYFYLDRMATKGPDISNAERSQLNSIATNVLVNGSPFSGYAVARYERSKGDPHAALAGYAWAGWLGDRRALTAMAGAQQELTGLNVTTPLEPAVAVLSFATLMRTAHSLQPALFSRKVESIPYEAPQ